MIWLMISGKTYINDSVKPGSIAGSFETAWESPSNIALVKYWGKSGDQIPMNASLSMTLKHALTRTSIRAIPKKQSSDTVALSYLFEGVNQPAFTAKIEKFLIRNANLLSFLKDFSIEVESSNTFPHSTGIASSASSMSALALGLLSLEVHFSKKEITADEFLQQASNLARLGSGSASRSVYGGYAMWGNIRLYPGSSDLWAIPVNENIHPLFSKLNDSILVVDSREKSVASRAGHERMNEHPFREGRMVQVENNLASLQDALINGNWDVFARIVENEALTLHGLMLSSDPGFFLIQPNTLVVIEKLRAFRDRHNLKITYTLDAGPNLHVLYPNENLEIIREFIQKELSPMCAGHQVIHDTTGEGPAPII